jgi:hypothetical protein
MVLLEQLIFIELIKKFSVFMEPKSLSLSSQKPVTGQHHWLSLGLLNNVISTATITQDLMRRERGICNLSEDIVTPETNEERQEKP